MKSRHLLRTTYWAGFLFSLHVALTVYVNSSFLGSMIPESVIGLLYAASAALAAIGLYVVPKLIGRLGSSRVLGFLILANIASLVVMIMSPIVPLVAACFVLYFAFNTLIYLGLDVLIERWSDAVVQGSVRGTYLTALNVGYMLAPFAAGFVADRLGFGVLYGLAIVMVIPVYLILALQLPAVRDVHPSKENLFAIARTFVANKKLKAAFLANFLLQFFYAWMVIYAPIYLHENAGLAWDDIGVLFTLMLSAFVLSQYPVGKLFDRFHGERLAMVIGLVVMGISTVMFVKAPGYSFAMLASVLFATRIGASLVEISTESYFFKNVHHDNTGAIGFFRNTYPVAYVIAPLLASGILAFSGTSTLFVILGVVCFAGAGLVITIRTK